MPEAIGHPALAGQRAPGPDLLVRRASPADLDALAAFFGGLSARTRLLRFFAAITPSRAMLARLCDAADGTDALVATHDGGIVGHAMAVERTGPDGGRTADIGVVVADTWQGRGLGSGLMRVLIACAQHRGITSLTMDVLPGNRAVLAMITSHWTTARTDRSPDCLTMHVRLPQPGSGQQRQAGQGAAGSGLGSVPRTSIRSMSLAGTASGSADS